MKRLRLSTRTALCAMLVAAACLYLVSCGGGSGASGPTVKIADRPGMLGGDSKPDFFEVEAAQVEPAALGTPLLIDQLPAACTVPRNRAFWYGIQLQAQQPYVITLQPSEADEDSDLYLFRPQSGQLRPLGNSRRGHDGDTLATPDWVAFTTNEGGIHHVAVTGWSPTTAGDPNNYRLEADQVRTVEVNGAASTGELAQLDSHFYTFQAQAGVPQTVTLTSTTGDADLFVYGAASYLLRGSDTGENEDVVSFTPDETGPNYVRVYGAATTSSYSLTVGAEASPLTNLFFLHHSVGDGLVVAGDMRGAIASYNSAHGTPFVFWDHGYNGDGLRDADGNSTGTSYDIPNDNTDVEGLYYLWTSTEADAVAARNSILDNHQVIAFKSCFPNAAITDAAMLQQYRDWYLAIRDFMDTRQDHLFVVMGFPPLHRLATNTTEANNARAFANWLKSATYLSGHANVVCFDLFDQLAKANDGSATANRLRYNYEIDHFDGGNSHPNDTANAIVGPALANFMCEQTRLFNESH